MWETNKKFIFVSYLVMVHDLVRGEESQEQEEEKEEEGRRRRRRNPRSRYAFVLETSVWDF